jgi:hypothetical protein
LKEKDREIELGKAMLIVGTIYLENEKCLADKRCFAL